MRYSLSEAVRGYSPLAGPLNSGQHLKGGIAVKTVETKISDRLQSQIDALVERGWFRSRSQVLQEALRRFLEAHRPELMERFIREDVEWGLRGRT